MKRFLPLLLTFVISVPCFAGRLVVVSQGFTHVGWKGSLDEANANGGLWIGQDATFWRSHNEWFDGPLLHVGVVESGATFGSSALGSFGTGSMTASTMGDAFWIVEFVPDFEGDVPPTTPLTVTVQGRVRGYTTASSTDTDLTVENVTTGPHIRWQALALPSQKTTVHSGDAWEVDPTLARIPISFANVDGHWTTTVTYAGGGSESFSSNFEGDSLTQPRAWVQTSFVRQEQLVGVGGYFVNPQWVTR